MDWVSLRAFSICFKVVVSISEGQLHSEKSSYYIDNIVGNIMVEPDFIAMEKL